MSIYYIASLRKGFFIEPLAKEAGVAVGTVYRILEEAA